jgi:hypothetical protein
MKILATQLAEKKTVSEKKEKVQEKSPCSSAIIQRGSRFFDKNG